MNKLIRELVEQARFTIHCDEEVEKFVESILIEVIATIYGSDIKDKKQDKLVDKLLYKFGMK